MRCERCGARMMEEHKESMLFGTTIVFQCSRCENQVKENLQDNIFHQLFHRSHVDDGQKRASPINLH